MREDTFVGVFLDLVHRLSHIHTASFQLNVDNWHTVDEQHHITTTGSAKRMFRLEPWLTDNLIDTLSCSYLTSIENGQINLFSEVYLVVRVVPPYHHLTAIDKLVHLVRVLQRIHLSHDLLHLSVSQWEVTQTVHVAVVVINDGRPVFDKGFLCWVHNHIRFPTMLGQEVGKGFLKIKFLQERTN